MKVWRKWIFPVLKVVIFGAIAVALIKIAFFPAGEAESSPLAPTGALSEPVVAVSTGTIVNTVELTGSIVSDPSVPARTTLQGEVSAIAVSAGQQVDAGAVIATVRQEIVQEPITGTDAEGNPTVTQPKPKYKAADVVSAVGGVVGPVAVIVGQTVAVGDTVASVAPASFSVTANLPPEDQFRLTVQPTEAQVSAVGGPGAFTCTALSISAAPPAASVDAGAPEVAQPGSAAATTGASVRCAVPGDIRVFSGLAATVILTGGSAEGALLLPVTAVKGNSATGSVWVVTEDGGQEERPVSLGLNDGTNVQVTEGLAEGDSVMQFVPVADPSDVPSEGCTEQPDGQVICIEGSVGG